MDFGTVEEESLIGFYRANALYIRYPSKTANGTSLRLIHGEDRRHIQSPVTCMQRA